MASIETIIQGYRCYSTDEEAVERIRLAHEIAWKAHAGQFRRSGEPYIVHPLSVAQILVDFKMDSSCICAALLHDTIEDTDITYDFIKEQLNDEIAGMVDALTSIKTSALAKKTPKEQERADTMRKIVLSTAKDPRVIVIKLADRWNNMQTLQYMSLEKRKQIALETMSIYAPFADRLGLYIIRREMENLSFSFIDPKNYQLYQDKQEQSKILLQKDIGELKKKITESLEKHGLEVTVYERFTTPYLLYLREQQKLLANYVYIIIITNSYLSCYPTLGLIHDIFTPLPGTTIRDYIAIPRSNGYQSLHTTILFKENVYPIQIRTAKMERIAMYGILQSSQESSRSRYDDWIKVLGEFVQDEKDSTYLIKGIENLAAQDKIYVFTPRGDYLGFPRDATVLDFAYRIHTDIGHRCRGALVDGQPASIRDKLVDGAMVEIIVADDYQIRHEWLQYANTQKSRSAIRAWSETQKHRQGLEFVKNALRMGLEKHNLILDNLLSEACFTTVLENLGAIDQNDLFEKIGNGILSLETVIKKILDEDGYAPSTSSGKSQLSRLLGNPFSRKKTDAVYIITNIHDPFINVSTCCNPVPGDSIVGLLPFEHGQVVVHRQDCQLLKQQNHQEQQIFKLKWGTEIAESYPEVYKIVTSNQKGLFSTILNRLESHSFQINDCHVSLVDNSYHIHLEIMLQPSHNSQNITRILESISGVIKVNQIHKRPKG
ncbi:MAG: RelA/SpoT family protein [bacterium]